MANTPGLLALTMKDDLLKIAQEQRKRHTKYQERYLCIDARNASAEEVRAWLDAAFRTLEEYWGPYTEFYPFLYIIVTLPAPSQDVEHQWAFIVTDDTEHDTLTVVQCWLEVQEAEVEASKTADGLSLRCVPGQALPSFIFVPLDERDDWFACIQQLEGDNYSF